MNQKKINWPTFSRLTQYISFHQKIFFGAVMATILLAVVTPMRPWLIEYTVDHYVKSGNLDMLFYFSGLMLIVLLVETILTYFQSFISNVLAQYVVKDIRVNLLRHLQNFKHQYFDHAPVGTLITRVVSDIEAMAEVFSEGLIGIVADILKLSVILGVMLFINWQLTLIAIIPVVFLFFCTNIFRKYIQKTSQEIRNQVAALNTFVQEHILGMQLVQLFNKELQEMEKFKKINAQHKTEQIKTIWAYSVFFPLVELFAATSLALLIWLGTKQILQQELSVGNLIAFIMYINILYRPIRQLADRFNNLQMGMVSAERVFALLDQQNNLLDNSGQLNTENIQGEIIFKHVNFAYKTNQPILKDISFKLPAGQTLALVGSTGSGKSSIANLIARYYEIQEGEILIDGENIQKYELNALRKSVVMVMQDVFLFSDSILNNLTLFDHTISFDQVVAASQLVGAHDFIMKLPDNYHFNVRERGNSLSTGQRQVLSFIRAYLHRPKILILDEATASIDSESERLIQKATALLTQNTTSIVIAHRLSTIQSADQILVIDKGEIIEQGNHQTLLSLNGLYKKMFELQFENFN